MRSSRTVIAAVVLLLVAGFLTRWVRSTRAKYTATLTPLRLPFDKLPRQLSPWTMSAELEVPPDVMRTAKVDDYVNRVYANSQSGRQVVAYIGYWGQENIGMGHGPEICYPSAGWTAEGPPSVQTIRVESPSGSRPIESAFHRFSRKDQAGTEQCVVLFTVATNEGFRGSSRGLFWHAPRISGGRFLAHVQVVAGVRDTDWKTAESDAMKFLESLLPEALACFPPLDPSRP